MAETQGGVGSAAMMVLSPEPLDGPVAQSLLACLDAELSALYPPEANFFDLPAEDVKEARGLFLVARMEGNAVGCGAVRLRAEVPAEAEIKRMYVAPEARGRGVGRALLQALEAHARSLGATRAVLETGGRQDGALALYRRAGYVPVPAFGPYVGAPLSLCFGKDLSGPPEV